MASSAKDPEDSYSDSSSEPEVPETQRPVLDAIKQHVFHIPAGPEDWKLRPEFPTGAEIRVPQIEAEPLPQNRIAGGWTSKNDYLETHYRLLRREGTEALRYAVNKYKSSITASDDEDLCIYSKVRIVGYLMTRLGPLCRISFSTEHAQKKILWSQSRRLMPGSVLAISTKRDNFKTICMTATVAQRPFRGGLDQTPPLVDIVWGDINEYVVDPEMELIIIEARSGYFEAVRHTLVGLQMAADSDSPLFKYIVDGNQDDAPASFIQKKPSLDLTSCLSRTADRDTVEWLRKYDVRQPSPDIRGQTSLDETQLMALHRMITKELCIVQGPPGTGKTFTSVEALKIMLANQNKNDPPIIVAAQTNHALDQLLTLCLDAGARIIRVGGRTESERVAEHTMYNARQKFRPGAEVLHKALDAKRRRACSKLADLATTMFNDTLLQPKDLLEAGVLTQEQYDSLVNDDMEQTEAHRIHGPFSLWLLGECVETQVLRNKHCDKNLSGDDEEYNREEYEYEDDFEHIADDEEDKDRIHGTFIPFAYKWSGKEPTHLSSWHKRAAKELRKADLFTIPKGMRGAVYQLLFERYIEKLKPQFTQCFVDYSHCCKELRANRWLRDVAVVKELQINIVGCTTTGLTKYRGFLSALGAKTMLIEEAAETREANITSALYPSIQQLVLVGDHQQLAPFCNVRWLGQKPYYLDMSMFERMVEHIGIPYVMLDKQRRMAPEIRAVVDSFYHGLVDHPVALKREPVPGMGDKRTWLFSHNWQDDIDSNHSRFNTEEASMIVGFFAYLVNNGVKPAQITVLTFYKAQRRLILKKLKTHPSLVAESYQVHTVDSYQGEENDIVLLSLVRSPPVGGEFSVGFLDNKNRVIVAISRARRGFYMFGNVVNAANASRESGEIWNPIWNAFIDQKRFDQRRGLPLQCQPHGKTVWVKNSDGWADNAGGCNEMCNFTRPCGHRCPLKCHTKPHEKMRCGSVCNKKLACGHVCQIWCKDPCNCVCDKFQAMKTQNQTRKMQDEAELHMDLEAILEAEDAESQQPTITVVGPRPIPAVQAPRLVPATVAKPRNIIRLPPPQQRKFNPPKPKSERKIAAATNQHIIRPPNRLITRLPNQLVIRPPPQRGPVVSRPEAAAYQRFARNVAIHDQANVRAHKASLAQTAGHEPIIRDSYRPVTLVDGQRVEASLSPEKLIKPNQSGSTSSSMVSSRGNDLTGILIPELVSVDEPSPKKAVDGHAPDIDAVITALSALPTNGKALPRVLSARTPQLDDSPHKHKEQSESTNSEPSRGTFDLLMDCGVSDATTVEPGDGTSSKATGSASLDLAVLMEQSVAGNIAGLEQEVTGSQPYGNLDDWMDTLVAGSSVADWDGVQTDATKPHVSATAEETPGNDPKMEDLLISL